MGRTIFVTVGTTLFDKLISAVSTESFLNWMKSKGYTRLVLQYGKGVEPSLPSQQQQHDDRIIDVECYRFRPTLDVDMKEADLIISHAGAGTVMEAMKFNKRLVVVINTLLMDNHQTELAQEMGDRNHLFVVNDPHEMMMKSTWNKFEEEFVPVPFEDGDENDFPQLIDSIMGFDTNKES